MKIYSHYGYNDFVIALGVKGHMIKEYFYNFEALNNDFTKEYSIGSTRSRCARKSYKTYH